MFTSIQVSLCDVQFLRPGSLPAVSSHVQEDSAGGRVNKRCCKPLRYDGVCRCNVVM